MRWRANQACQNASRRESAERRAHAASIWETDDAHAERGSRHARTARPRRYLIRILRRHSFAAGVAAGEGDDQTLAPAQARARVHIGRGMHRATRKRGGEGGDGGARGCGAYIHIYPSDHRCLYGTVTGVGGKFQNPFLRPGTPRRSLYGRYVRFLLISETPRPRLRENPIFGVNATHRGVKQSNEFEPRANAPNRPIVHQA